MHCVDRNRRSLKRRPYETFSEGYIPCIGPCHDRWDGAASVSENAVTDAGPQDDIQVHQTHEGLQWQALQKQDSQKQNDYCNAPGAAGDSVIGATAGNALGPGGGRSVEEMRNAFQGTGVRFYLSSVSSPPQRTPDPMSADIDNRAAAAAVRAPDLKTLPSEGREPTRAPRRLFPELPAQLQELVDSAWRRLRTGASTRPASPRAGHAPVAPCAGLMPWAFEPT
jgi:hypothetical protein